MGYQFQNPKPISDKKKFNSFIIGIIFEEQKKLKYSYNLPYLSNMTSSSQGGYFENWAFCKICKFPRNQFGLI
jgi:hypothetical protein